MNTRPMRSEDRPFWTAERDRMSTAGANVGPTAIMDQTFRGQSIKDMFDRALAWGHGGAR